MTREEMKRDLEWEIAAILSYFVRDLSEDNIVTDEPLMYALDGGDSYTTDVAAIAAQWLGVLISWLKNDEADELNHLSLLAWLRETKPTLYESCRDFEKRGELLGILTLKPIQDVYLEFIQSRQYKESAEYEYDEATKELLEELTKVEWEFSPDKVTQISSYDAVKAAAIKYIERHNIELPQPKSYVAGLPFHYHEDKAAFLKQLRRKEQGH